MRRYIALAISIIAVFFMNDCIIAEPDIMTIFDFSEILPDGLSEDWTHILPKKQKAYTNYLVDHDSKGFYLKIRSGGTGSWIEKSLGSIDVSQVSVMEWSWMVLRFPEVEWEQDKSDDDFAIRIELVYDYKGSAFNILNIIRKGLLRTIFQRYPPELVVSYVWAYRVPAEKPYVSPANKRLIVIPIESGKSMRGIWIKESRNIKTDLDEYITDKRIVLKKIRIRSDTDNSLSSSESGLKNLLLRAP